MKQLDPLRNMKTLVSLKHAAERGAKIVKYKLAGEVAFISLDDGEYVALLAAPGDYDELPRIYEPRDFQSLFEEVGYHLVPAGIVTEGEHSALVDADRAQRLKDHERRLKYREAQERAYYERLKKRFEREERTG